VPRQLIESSDSGTRVWVADQAAGVARLKTVTVGMAGDTELVEVVEGLTVADKLIASGREGLRDGQRITVTGEEPNGSGSTHSLSKHPARLPGAGDNPKQGKR
jgi:multidrug efflux pump subunit AcrA (membrane-fusion protein)